MSRIENSKNPRCIYWHIASRYCDIYNAKMVGSYSYYGSNGWHRIKRKDGVFVGITKLSYMCKETELCKLSSELGFPLEELLDDDSKDVLLQNSSGDIFLDKSIAYACLAKNHCTSTERSEVILKSQFPNFTCDTIGNSQIMYENMGFAYEFLFKSLVTFEFKLPRQDHKIKELYAQIEDNYVITKILDIIDNSNWDNIDEFIDFLTLLVDPQRRYAGQSPCSNLSEFLSNGSYGSPIQNHNKVGIGNLHDLFLKFHSVATNKKDSINEKYQNLICKLHKIFHDHAKHRGYSKFRFGKRGNLILCR